MAPLTCVYLGCREELFYQLGARQFGDFGKLHLDPPPSIRSLLELSVTCENGISEAGLTVESVIDVSLHLYAKMVVHLDGELNFPSDNHRTSDRPTRNAPGILCNECH